MSAEPTPTADPLAKLRKLYGSDPRADVHTFPLQPDLLQSDMFLFWLDRSASRFTFFTADDVEEIVDGVVRKRNDERLLSQLHGTLTEHWPTLAKLNQLGAGVFVTINETNQKGRKAENIVRTRGIWREDDAGVRLKQPLPLAPDLIVATSPGRAHEHIFIEGLSFDEHRAIMETMVERHGSCPDAKDLCRVLRLPGFFHMKRTPFLVRIIGGRANEPGWQRYGADQVRQAYPPIERKPAPTAPATDKARADVDLARVKEALKFITFDPRWSWLRVGMALHNADPDPHGEARELWDEWSKQSAKFDQDNSDARWASFGKRKNGRPVTVASIFKAAKAAGWKPPHIPHDGAGFEPVDSVEPDMTILDRHSIPAPRFPVEILGGLRQWAEQQAEMRNCPVDYLGGASLSVIAAVIGHTRKVRAWPTFEQPCVLWVALAGDPSQKKSPPLEACLNALSRLEAELAKKAAPALREFETRKYIATAARKQWEKEVDESMKAGRPIESLPPRPAAADEPAEPVFPRVRVGDITAERLLQILATQRRGLLWARQELAGLLTGLNQYRGGKGNDRQLLLEAYDAGPLPRDRMSDGVAIESVHVGLVGGLQPDKVDGLLLNGDDDGLFARCACIWPDRVPLEVPDAELSDTGQLDHVLTRLSGLDFGVEDKPIVLPLDVEARAIYDAWYLAQEPKLAGATGLYQGALGKRQGLVLRLALVIEHLNWACGTDPSPPTVVGAAAVTAAITLCDSYLDAMLLRVLGGASTPDAERAARVLARAIVDEKVEIINARVLKQRKRVQGLPSDRVDMAIQHLITRGWLTEAPKSDVGRPREDFVVSLAVHRLAHGRKTGT